MASQETPSAPAVAQEPTSLAAYEDLKLLIPSLDGELNQLRTALREHNLWLQRYGHSSSSTPVPNPTPPTRPSAATASSSIPEYTVPIAPAPSSSSVPPYSAPSSSSAVPTASSATPEYTAIASGIVGGGVGASTDLPAYSASDVPPYTGGGSTRDEVQHRALQITEWLAEGEDLLREYSTRFAQLGEELGMGFEDVLGTWAEGAADNALPDYEVIGREELMVGGVGEVPPPYVGKGGGN